MSERAKPVMATSTTTSSYENLSPQIIARIAREIHDLSSNPPPGIRLLEDHNESIAEINVEIDGPEETPYAGGTFHVKLVLSQDFPSSPPRGFFITKIYHPNVSSNGDICVNTLKKDWNAEVTLIHILQVIRCLLIVPFPESSLNDEAGKQFMESYEDYAKRARLMTSVHAMRKMASSSCVDSEADPASGSGAGNGAKRKFTSSTSAQVEKKLKETKKKGLKRL